MTSLCRNSARAITLATLTLTCACRFDTSGVGPLIGDGAPRPPDLQPADVVGPEGPRPDAPPDLPRQDWLEGWPLRKRIDISAAMLGGSPLPLNGFPLLVRIDGDAGLASRAHAKAFDLRFTAANGRRVLSHEIERYDPASGRLEAWVRVPVVAAEDETTIYMYYGNPTAADGANPGVLWRESSCEAVWHLGDDPAVGFTDSTGNLPRGQARAVMDPKTRVAGLIAGATRFDGSTHVIDLGPFDISPATNDDGVTLQAWVYLLGSHGRVISKATGVQASQHTWMVDVEAQIPRFRLKFREKGSGSLVTLELVAPTGLPTNQWHHLAATHDGQEMKLYVNGDAVASLPAKGKVATEAEVPVAIGGHPLPGDSRFFAGILDEVRVCHISRSQTWLTAEHNNQSPGAGYLTITDQQR